MNGQRAISMMLLVLLGATLTAAQERRQIAQGRSGRLHNFIDAGVAHTLFVSEGRVWAWGANSQGQLGNSGAGPLSTVPVRVDQSGGLAGVIAVAAGADHSVALDSTGHVWTWGDNSRGQLGDGTAADRPVPFKIGGIPGFSGRITAIAAGEHFTLAIDAGGDVWSWGANSWGQLGDGTTLDRNVPAPVAGIVGVKQLDAGVGHTLALDSRGRVWSWGLNLHGQLGDTTFANHSIPAEIFHSGPQQNFIEIAAGGEHGLAIDELGNVWSWGADNAGQLGNGAVAGDQPAPVWVNQVNGYSRAVRIAAGNLHSLALTSKGRVFAWGANPEGQLGDGSPLPGPQRDDPFQVTGISGLPGATAIAAGPMHSVALRSDGKLLTWGRNQEGQLGDGSTSFPGVGSPLQVPVVALRGILAISGGWKQTYVLHADGTVWTWGENQEGQLGDGTFTDRSRPARVEGLTDIIALSGSTSNALALRSDGTVWGWGKNHAGQMGLPPNTGQDCPIPAGNVCRPIQMPVPDNAKAIDAGTYFNLVILDDGDVWSWGQGADGQLGRGFVAADPVPGPAGVGSAISVAGGGDHSLALIADGTVMAWGRNGNCELGLANCCISPATRCSNPTPQPSQGFPAQVAGPNGIGVLFNITALGTTLYHASYALDGHGRVYSWGDNNSGQLGDGNSSGFWVGSFPDWVRGPGGAPQLLDIAAISGGGHHALGLGADGTAYGWGGNTFGQLGIGVAGGPQVFPVTPSCMFGAIGLPAGGQLQHATVRRDDWTRCSVGLNDFGQLGDGTLNNTSTYLCDTNLIGTTVFLEDPQTSARIFWEPSQQASSYRVYEGLVPAGAPFAYTHACATPAGVSLPELIHLPAPPNPGDLFYFLVAARTTACGETHLGRSSDYTLRPKPMPCP